MNAEMIKSIITGILGISFFGYVFWGVHSMDKKMRDAGWFSKKD